MRYLKYVLFLTFLFPAFATAQQDEIIVTATKRSAAYGYSEASQPHIVMKRRPDNIILSVRVVCDTRNPVTRLKELEQSMENVVTAALQNPQVEVGLVVEREDEEGNELALVKPYDQSKFGEYVGGGGRPDTSGISMIFKTKVTDSYKDEDAALKVLTDFIESINVVGRTEVSYDVDEPILSVLRPRQYRHDIIRQIADDANKVANAFGPNYNVRVSGLESPIVFYQTDSLELTLYIPYKFQVVHRD